MAGRVAGQRFKPHPVKDSAGLHDVHSVSLVQWIQRLPDTRGARCAGRMGVLPLLARDYIPGAREGRLAASRAVSPSDTVLVQVGEQDEVNGLWPDPEAL